MSVLNLDLHTLTPWVRLFLALPLMAWVLRALWLRGLGALVRRAIEAGLTAPRGRVSSAPVSPSVTVPPRAAPNRSHLRRRKLTLNETGLALALAQEQLAHRTTARRLATLSGLVPAVLPTSAADDGLEHRHVRSALDSARKRLAIVRQEHA